MSKPDEKINFSAFNHRPKAYTPGGDDEIPAIDEGEDNAHSPQERRIDEQSAFMSSRRMFEAGDTYYEMQKVAREKARTTGLAIDSSILYPSNKSTMRDCQSRSVRTVDFKKGNEILQLSPLNADDDGDEDGRYYSTYLPRTQPVTIHISDKKKSKKSPSPPTLTSKHVRLLSHRDHDKEGMRERLKAKLDKRKEQNEQQATKEEKKQENTIKNRKSVKPEELPKELLEQFDDFKVGTKNKVIPKKKKAKKYKNPQPQKAKKDVEMKKSSKEEIQQDLLEVDEGISFLETDKENSIESIYNDNDDSEIDEKSEKTSKESSTDSDIITSDDQCTITKHQKPRYIDRRSKDEQHRDEQIQKRTDEFLRKLYHKYFDNPDVIQYVPNKN